MKLGTNDISAVKIGSTDVNKVYIGSTEVWSSFTGLLDTYTGAAAAYSLRKLRAGYTGSAIKVRRAVGTPAETYIGFVNNELDVATLESFCSGTDGYVVTWYDQSGNGNDATQGTDVNQPQIVSSGSVILENGKPTIQFDGSDDSLTLNNMSAMTDITFNVVVKNDTSNQDTVFIDYGIGQTNSFAIGFGNLGTANRIGSRSRVNGGNTYIGADIDVNTQQRLVTLVGDSTTPANGEFYLDETQYSDAIGTRSTDGSALGSRGDGTSTLDGNIQEAIIYEFKQSASNLTGISDNINDFYSIY